MARFFFTFFCFILLTWGCPLSAQDGAAHSYVGKGPLKVFILAGQSNMEGHGQSEHIKMAAEDAQTRSEFAPLMNGNNYVVRKDVWISYGNRRGGLSVGYGVSGSKVGPEIGFGWHIGELLGEQVLLIKTAWGGHSLKEKFLPPSMGGPGPSYTQMVKEARDVLNNLKSYFPDYNEKAGYEIVGLVWHQAWNDMIDNAQNAESPPYKSYSERQGGLLRDLRKEFNSPDMLMVIGECGVGGPNTNSKGNNFRKGQEATTLTDEFKDTTRFVKTAQFWDEDERFKSNQGYHYNGNGKIYYFKGKAMAYAMYDLMPKITFDDVTKYLDDHSKPAYDAIRSKKYPDAVVELSSYQKYLTEHKSQLSEESYDLKKTIFDILDKELSGVIKPAVDEIIHLKLIKDYYGLSLQLPKMYKSLKGVPAFEEAAGDLEKQLKSKEVLQEIKIGKKFYSYIESFIKAEENEAYVRTEANAKQYEKYLMSHIADKAPDSVYGKAATIAAQELINPKKPVREPQDYLSLVGQ